jgi:hypothetical protein
MQKQSTQESRPALNTVSRRFDRMHLRFGGLLLLSLTLAACAKKEEAKIELPPEAVAQIEAQVIPPPNAPASAPIQDRLVGAVHPQMTELLLRFEQQFNRMPTNFWEFSGRMMDSVPAAPPGMRYEIDPVDKAVKLVRNTQ